MKLQKKKKKKETSVNQDRDKKIKQKQKTQNDSIIHILVECTWYIYQAISVTLCDIKQVSKFRKIKFIQNILST